MSRVTRSIVSYLFLITSFSLYGMVYDNRYYPSLQRPYISIEDRSSHFALDFFMGTSSEAIGPVENEIGLCEIFGDFDQGQLSKAIDAIGGVNPLLPQFRGSKIPYKVDGKRQLQGLTFSAEKTLGRDWVSVGLYWGLMRVNSSCEFRLKRTDVSVVLLPNDKDELEAMLRQMFQQIGLNCKHSDQVGMMDADAYIHFKKSWDHEYKFRRIDLGFRFGTLMGLGEHKTLGSAASIPFGGDGHWGLYGSIDSEFEVKEDWKFGILLRLSKRFAKTRVRRMPAVGEPLIFGAVIGQAEVNPGYTFVFSPYISFEDLRQGFGARIIYNLVKHGQDGWTDKRCDKAIPVDLCKVIEKSSWGSDYITIGFFYDFGKTKVVRDFQPIIMFNWDVPSGLFATEQAAKTHKVSLGVEFSF